MQSLYYQKDGIKWLENDGYKPQRRISVPIIRLLDDNLTERLFSWLLNEKMVRI
ncbi:hypothetical protein PrNR1418_42300 (plasmid) [Providencia rettgeri]|uniref:Uncharacterized protein n=1 Tax=Providencia rettgeri TaxID=587 RepID=A0A5K7Y9D3_PRORE|nr:hypothetical protein pBML2526_2210 [Providencia rettgeri]BDH20939.1 hypothetical protein PrNR1418_42300 [Providencia rettgeri]